MTIPRIPKSGLAHLHVRMRLRQHGMSRAHLDDIRALPCLICLHTPDQGVTIDPHHLMRLQPHDPGRRGDGGVKAADRWTVPLCRIPHHAEVTDAPDDEQWFAARNYNARDVAARLWAAQGDRKQQLRIIFRAAARAKLLLRGQQQVADTWDDMTESLDAWIRAQEDQDEDRRRLVIQVPR